MGFRAFDNVDVGPPRPFLRAVLALLTLCIPNVECLKVQLPPKHDADVDQDQRQPGDGDNSKHKCNEVGEFEVEIDALSWSAFARDSSANLTMYSQALGASAGERLAHWLEATERSTGHAAPNVAKVARTDRSGVIPPSCPADVPANDPYWAQTEPYIIWKAGKKLTYNECQYSGGCTRQFTNLQRLESIRGTLRATKQLLQSRAMQYVLFGGSAIGAWRCHDVLPWDVDADVLVHQHHLPALMNLLTGMAGKRSVDLAQLGLPGFVMLEKTPGCQPLSIVDTSTGFFTDIFPMLPMQGTPQPDHILAAGQVLVPFWWGKHQCDSTKLFPPCKNEWKCQRFGLSTTLPAAFCPMVGDPHFACAAQLYPWLVEQFGPGVHNADRPTRPRPALVAAIADNRRQEINKSAVLPTHRSIDRHIFSPEVAGGQKTDIHASADSTLLVQQRVAQAFHGLHDGNHSNGFFGLLVVAYLLVPVLLWCASAPLTVQVFAVYISLYMAWSMLTFAARDGSHSSAILVLNSLLLKISLSLILWRSWDASSFLELPAAIWKARKTLRQYALPAGLYALGDILRVASLRATNPSTFAVLFNSRVLFLVFAWQYWMGRRLKPIHWLSLGMILAGCYAKEAHNLHLKGESSDANTRLYLGYAGILLLGVCTATAAVLNERLLQHEPDVGVNLQNLGMYGWGLVWTSAIALGWVLVEPSNTTTSLFHADAWLAIWGHPLVIAQVVILALYGVTTGYFLRYLSNIAREVALGAFAVLSVAMDVLVFEESLTLLELAGVALLLLGIGLFAWRPVVAAAEEEALDEEATAKIVGDGVDTSKYILADDRSTSDGSTSAPRSPPGELASQSMKQPLSNP